MRASTLLQLFSKLTKRFEEHNLAGVGIYDCRQAQVRKQLGRLPAGPALAEPEGVVARQPQGLEVQIIDKPTRATAISTMTWRVRCPC